jgi:TPR repeat protein
MDELTAGALVLPRLFPAIALLSLTIAGCASHSPIPSIDNPFDEPQVHQRPRPHIAVPVMPPRKVQTGSASDSKAPLQTYRPAVAFALADYEAPAVSTTSSTPASSNETRGPGIGTDEAFNEAMAYGAVGDSASMIGLLEQSARRGNADAHYELARMYQQGQLLQADMAQSVIHLNLAMNFGHAESIRVLGWLYLTGNSVPESREYGQKLLEKAAETSTRAMREYGLALANQREPHLNDIERGKVYLHEAAGLGDLAAQQALSDFFGEPLPTIRSRSYSEASIDTIEPTPEPEAAVMTAEGVKIRALAGDIEAAYLYALNVSIRKFHSSEPDYEAYCWHAAAAELGSEKSESELRFLAGVRPGSERRNPGRLDECISNLVERMSVPSGISQYRIIE